MFGVSEISVAVGNASNKVKKEAKYPEKTKFFFDAVIKYFSRLDRRFKEEIGVNRFDQL
ncbi:MAG: hypothetical protein KGI27_07600 [Thaumarchaeota archaeon]|nr:hypothetical protein [Nitrososphaerota archaeon]